MLGVHIFPDPSTGGNITMFNLPDVVDVNPVYYYATMIKERDIALAKSVFMLRNLRLRLDLEKKIKDKALMDWQKMYQTALKHELPQQLINLFNSKKKDQINSLKDFVMTSEDWFSFIIQSWDSYKFRFSMYSSHTRQKNL